MKTYEFEGLSRLNIKLNRWGSDQDYRLKVRNERGRIIFIGNVSKAKNIKLISKYYKIPEDVVKENLSKDFKLKQGSYEIENGEMYEKHTFEHLTQDELTENVKAILMSKVIAFKANLQFGYILIDITNGEEIYYYPSWNTSYFDKPIRINKIKDIESEIIAPMRSVDLSEKVKYPNSKYKLKEIVSINLIIYYRNFRMGDGEKIQIPKVIKNSPYIIDFKNTNNKCVFYCIAYHLGDSSRQDRMIGGAKNRFKQYCEFKGIEYSFDVFKNAQPIDILQFDQLEQCFNIGIDVFEMDESTSAFSRIRETDMLTENIVNILYYKNHAMYIKDTDRLIQNYICSKCKAIFGDSKKLADHKKNKCEFEVFDSFVKKPTVYMPKENKIKGLHEKYNIKSVDHYLDHQIVFDFESYPLIINEQKGGKMINGVLEDVKTVYTDRHIPMSVSVCDSLTQIPKCFINEDPKQLVDDMVKYMHEIANKIAQLNNEKFKRLIKAIEEKENYIEGKRPKSFDEYNLMMSKYFELKRKIKEDHETKDEVIELKKQLKEQNGKIKKFLEEHPEVESFDKMHTKIASESEGLSKMLKRIPVIGFNSGRYDINLIKKDLFEALIKYNKVNEEDDGSKSLNTIKNPSYMCISTDHMKKLDISNYLAPGTSYDKYLKAYLGGCQCENPIECVCGLTKGHFCHEYMRSASSKEAFAKLEETSLPPKSAFALKGKQLTNDEYKRLQFAWSFYGMRTLKDLLIWYNNLDVKPFLQAIAKQREFYKRYELDMFSDGISLPSLAEKIMYQTGYDLYGEKRARRVATEGRGRKYYEFAVRTIRDNISSKTSIYTPTFEMYEKDITGTYLVVYSKGKSSQKYISLILGFKDIKLANITKDAIISKFSDIDCIVQEPRTDQMFSYPVKRLEGYKTQDSKAGRKFNLTIKYLNDHLKEARYMCCHCLCALTPDNVSVDRINNSKGHIFGNVMVSCVQCNVARKDMNMRAFHHQKMIEKNADKLVWSIDEERKDIFHKMKANIAGGPSIIFSRYAKRNETLIRGGKLCKKVIGYDANALYLGCLGDYMPCGRLTTIEVYDGIIDDIKNDKIFGFLECDIRTPEHLKDYFSEMTPIFKNTKIDSSQEDVIGQHMTEYAKSVNRMHTKSKKLIGSYFGDKILIYTPLLKWYLEHGMEITKIYSFIKAAKHRPFKPFMDEVSNARRAGDADPSKAIIADCMKLVGNSASGRSGMDKSKHKQVKYESDRSSALEIIEKNNFYDLEELNGAYEITLKKRKIQNNNPIHLSIAIYQLAKLRMLQFYYDFIDFYIDRSDFQYVEMDTDSAYIAFSDEEPFENLIKPELREHFAQNKYRWLPRDHNEAIAKYDRRKAGLFKEEWRGDALVALSSKNYICYMIDEKTLKHDKGKKCKVSAKGVQQGGNKNSDILNPESFEKVVKNRICMEATNSGFRIDKGTCSMITYTQNKIGLNYWYDKRQVLSDGITTAPLPI